MSKKTTTPPSTAPVVPGYIPLLHVALDRIEALLHEHGILVGDDTTNSEWISGAADEMLPRMRALIDGEVQEFDPLTLPALLDGARSVSDATPGGVAILSAAYEIADILVSVVLGMPEPNPCVVDLLKNALAEARPNPKVDAAPASVPAGAPAALATAPSTASSNEPLLIPAAVHDLAQEITWQIEGTLTTLFAASTNRSNGDVLPWTVRSVAARLNDLNNMLMAALDVESNGGADEVEGRMRAVVYGEFNEMAQGVTA